jgi:hypothetical protein
MLPSTTANHLPGRLRTGRLGQGIALLGLLCIATWAAATLTLAGSAHAAATPTMTFKGSLNALGVLTSINLSPTSVAVPAGGAVEFVNKSGTNLTLTVGSESIALGNGKSRTVSFPGAASARQVAASATAFNLPVVGSLTSTIGTVNVGALPRTDPDPDPPQNDPAPQPEPAPGGEPTGPGANQGSAPGSGQPGAPPNLGRDPVARGGMADADPRGSGSDPRTGEAQDGSLAAPPDAGNDTAVRDTTATTEGGGGGIGLLILVATVLLGGVGTAAIRTVLALRDAPALTR